MARVVIAVLAPQQPEETMMRRSLLSAAVALVLGGSTTYAVLADDLVPPGSKLELLYTRSAPIKGGLTEGVAAAPDGTIYFSEIPFGEDKGMIMRFDPEDEDDHGLRRGQPQVERPDVRRQGRSDRLRGFRRRRPVRCALGREDRRSARSSPTDTRASGSTPATTSASTRRGGSISPTRATWAPSLASWSIAPSTGSTPTGRSSRSPTTSRSPTASRSAPTRRRSTSPTTTTAPTGSTPTARRPRTGR